jgi:hypothetical protein
MRRNVDVEAAVVAKYVVLEPFLDERARRLRAAAESRAIGFGGDALVSAATGLARQTIRRGRQQVEAGLVATGRIRQPGAGRPTLEAKQPGLAVALEQLVEPLTRGDPTSPLRWTCKGRANLTAALVKQGWAVSSTTVGRLLHDLGYRRQSVRKSREGTSHPDRNAQFEWINRMAAAFLERRQPVISVDTKKKELVGDFKNAGRERQPSRTPDVARVHDFPSDALGKAIPYGVYDMARNEAWVSVGRASRTAPRDPPIPHRQNPSRTVRGIAVLRESEQVVARPHRTTPTVATIARAPAPRHYVAVGPAVGCSGIGGDRPQVNG